MKVGDKFPVTIAGQTVAQAEVRETNLGGETPNVTLVVPGTIVVMGVRTQLEDTPAPPQDTSGSSTIIEGVERTSAGGDNGNPTNTESGGTSEGASGGTEQEASTPAPANNEGNAEPVDATNAEVVNSDESTSN